MKASDVVDEMRVKVISVPEDSPEYDEFLNKYGSIVGEVFEGLYRKLEWVYVHLDGEIVPYEFKISEIEPFNLTKMRTVITETVKGKGWDGEDILDINSCLYGTFKEGEEVVVVSKDDFEKLVDDYERMKLR